MFGFVPIGAAGTLIRPMVEKIAREIGRLDYSVTCIGVEAQSAPTEWFSEVERTHDFVLYVAETSDGGWRQVVSRQVDRLFRIGRGDRKPPGLDGGVRIPSPLQASEAGGPDPGASGRHQISVGLGGLDGCSRTPARMFHLKPRPRGRPAADRAWS